MCTRRLVILVASVGIIVAASAVIEGQYVSGDPCPWCPRSSTHTYYNHDANGNYTGKDRRTILDGAGQNLRFSCRPGAVCTPCASCHTSTARVSVPADASLEVILRSIADSVQRHETTYFPRAVIRLAEGQKQSFGERTYLALKGRDLILYSREGKELVQYPPDTQVWRDLLGQAALLYFPGLGEPRVLGTIR
jgi:uncharacterized protein RhaS with RHS repeats